MTIYAVKIPSEHSFTSDVAYVWEMKDSYFPMVNIVNHTLFDNLLDDSQLYTKVYTEDYHRGEEETITPSIKMKELREMRKNFILNSISKLKEHERR